MAAPAPPSISGAWVALRLAVDRLMEAGAIKEDPITAQGRRDFLRHLSRARRCSTSTTSRTSNADADANFVLIEGGQIAEVQATAEGATYDEEGLLRLLRLAQMGCDQIFKAQDGGGDEVTRKPRLRQAGHRHA